MKKWLISLIFACSVYLLKFEYCLAMEKRMNKQLVQSSNDMEKGLYLRAYELYLLEEAGNDVSQELDNLKKETKYALCQTDDPSLQAEITQLKMIITLGELAAARRVGNEKLTVVNFGNFAKKLLQ